MQTLRDSFPFVTARNDDGDRGFLQLHRMFTQMC
jgi:hypothetical protein